MTAGGCSKSGERAETRAVIAAPAPVQKRSMSSLDKVMRRLVPRTRDVAYEAMPAAERAILADVARGLLGAAAAPGGVPEAALTTWNAQARQAGYAVERWRVRGTSHAVLREIYEERRGGGTYVFRMSAHDAPADGHAVVLQAPHAYFDVGTAEIAAHLYFFAPGRERIRALYVSSMHRHQKADGERRIEASNPADVCHNPDHVFNAMTGAAADMLAGRAGLLHVVQLHGFDERSDIEGEIDVVLSAGTVAQRSALGEALAARLEGAVIRRFPEDFGELGGSTNVQRKLLDGRADTHFAHLELSRELRDALRDDAGKRDRLAAALAHGLVMAREGQGGAP